jgi:hypothetical protein
MVCGTIAAAMAAEIIANAIIAALADGAVAIDKLEAEPDSVGRGHRVPKRPDRGLDRACPAPRWSPIRSGGTSTLKVIAETLNARSIPAPRGGSWSAVQVLRVLARQAYGSTRLSYEDRPNHILLAEYGSLPPGLIE